MHEYYYRGNSVTNAAGKELNGMVPRKLARETRTTLMATAKRPLQNHREFRLACERLLQGARNLQICIGLQLIGSLWHCE